MPQQIAFIDGEEPKTKSFFIGQGGECTTVYSDDFRNIYDGLGAQIERASNVEYDKDRGKWIAKLADGTEIAEDENRGKAIEKEVAHLNKMMGNAEAIPSFSNR